VIEGQLGELDGLLHVARDHGDEAGIEVLGDQLGDHVGGARGDIGWLDHGVVAGRQNADQRRKDQEGRVVPGAHDAHHALGLVDHVARRRQRLDAGGDLLGLHPLLDVALGQTDLAQIGENFRQHGFVGGTVTKVGHHRLDQFVTVLTNCLAQDRERFDALLGIRDAPVEEGLLLGLQQRQQGVLGRRFLLARQARYGNGLGCAHMGVPPR